MSEQEQEQAQPEPETQEDVPLEEPEIAPEPEPEPEPAPEPEPEPEQGSTSAEQEAAYRSLDTKADNYLKGVVKIANGAGLPLVQCELCADAYPGVRWGEPQNDVARTMLAVVGANGAESPLLDDPDAVGCDRCGTFGWTKLPSHVPGNTERLCKKCNGAGWLDTNPQSGTLQAPVAAPENGPGEVMPGVPADDPSVVDLRARGFTVIPPMQIAGAETVQ